MSFYEDGWINQLVHYFPISTNRMITFPAFQKITPSLFSVGSSLASSSCGFSAKRREWSHSESNTLTCSSGQVTAICLPLCKTSTRFGWTDVHPQLAHCIKASLRRRLVEAFRASTDVAKEDKRITVYSVVVPCYMWSPITFCFSNA